MNQLGAIVTGNNLNSRWQGGFDLRQLLLNTVNYVQRIQPIAHHHDAADSFALAIPFGHAFTNIRPKRNRAYVLDQNRRAVLRH